MNCLLRIIINSILVLDVPGVFGWMFVPHSACWTIVSFPHSNLLLIRKCNTKQSAILSVSGGSRWLLITSCRNLCFVLLYRKHRSLLNNKSQSIDSGGASPRVRDRFLSGPVHSFYLSVCFFHIRFSTASKHSIESTGVLIYWLSSHDVWKSWG